MPQPREITLCLAEMTEDLSAGDGLEVLVKDSEV